MDVCALGGPSVSVSGDRQKHVSSGIALGRGQSAEQVREELLLPDVWELSAVDAFGTF